MGAYDTVVLVIVGLATFIGWRKGLATQIAAIISMVASFFVAVRFREPVAAQIDAEPPWNRFAAMFILYLGTSLVIWLFFRQIRSSIEKMRLGEFDRQMGAIFGAVKGVALASVVTLFAFTMLQEPQRQAIIRSKSGVWIARVIHGSKSIIPVEVRRYIEPYLRNLDEGFGPYPTGMQYATPQVPGVPTNGTWTYPPQPNAAPSNSWQPPPATDPGRSNYEYRPATPPPANPWYRPGDDRRATGESDPYR